MTPQTLTAHAHNINAAILKDQTMTKDNHAEQQARAQYESIVFMLDALDVDFDRLEELRDDRNTYINENLGNLASPEVHLIAWAQENPDDAEELAELEAAAGDCTDEEEARDRIMEDPLEIQVRSDWTNPGKKLAPGEFMILLCTGGPAVRIVGELDQYSEPCRAWLEYQDWGTPWTQYFKADSATLCRYASHFFGG